LTNGYAMVVIADHFVGKILTLGEPNQNGNADQP